MNIFICAFYALIECNVLISLIRYTNDIPSNTGACTKNIFYFRGGCGVVSVVHFHTCTTRSRYNFNCRIIRLIVNFSRTGNNFPKVGKPRQIINRNFICLLRSFGWHFVGDVRVGIRTFEISPFPKQGPPVLVSYSLSLLNCNVTRVFVRFDEVETVT